MRRSAYCWLAARSALPRLYDAGVEWLVLLFVAAIVGVTVVWPLTRGRWYFTPDVAERANDVANQVYATRPDDGFNEVPFDPVPRRSLTPEGRTEPGMAAHEEELR